MSLGKNRANAEKKEGKFIQKIKKGKYSHFFNNERIIKIIKCGRESFLKDIIAPIYLEKVKRYPYKTDYIVKTEKDTYRVSHKSGVSSCVCSGSLQETIGVCEVLQNEIKDINDSLKNNLKKFLEDLKFYENEIYEKYSSTRLKIYGKNRETTVSKQKSNKDVVFLKKIVKKLNKSYEKNIKNTDLEKLLLYEQSTFNFRILKQHRKKCLGIPDCFIFENKDNVRIEYDPRKIKIGNANFNMKSSQGKNPYRAIWIRFNMETIH